MFRNSRLHLSSLHADLYHRLQPMNTVYGGVAIDLVVACLLCVALLWLIERFDAAGNSLAWAILAAVIIRQARAAIVMWHRPPGSLAVVGLAVGLALWFMRRAWYRSSVKVFRLVLSVLGVCVFWMLPQLVYLAVRPEPHDVQQFARAVSPARVPQRRVIWILYDELSQNQVFDHRQPDISLPQLDKFRSQSVMFSNVQPAGIFTELVLPSLLDGKIVTDLRSDLSGNLFVKTSRHWQLYQPSKTLFADAQHAGWSTGVAGWYNPYCRTYATYLNWCAWTMRLPIPGKYQQGQSLWQNVKAPLSRTEATPTDDTQTTPEGHADDYRDLMRWSHELIDDGSIGFVFLHLPLPHPFGFYDRKTGKLGVGGGSYLDSLVLTDRSLGQIMQWISETRLASKTTVIVCSDHSWRVPLWRSRMTEEEKKASGGKFDTRPVLMVRFPGETTPDVVSKPFPAIREHALVESLLHDPMSAEELKTWAGKQ